MTLNPGAVFLPGRGIPFIADPDTPAPSYKTMTPTSPGSGWTAMGHTSRDNNVALSKDGGDPTVQGTWWDPAFRTTYADVNWGITINALQMDRTTLDLAFNGEYDTDGHGYIVPASITAVEKALFVLCLDGTGRMGTYMPRASVTLGDAPSFDPTKFFEVPLAASILNSDELGGIMEWFHPALEPPVATTALPTGAAAASTITITGTGFTSATAVKFGAVPATSFVVVSDTKITAVVPAGSAGSAPITVTNINGDSTALAYTRGA